MTFVERNKAIRRLIALKRYEQPDPEMHARILCSIRTRIAEESTTAEAPAWGDVARSGLPAFRYGLALVVLGLLSVHTMMTPTLPLMQSQLPEPLTTRRVLAERRAAASATNPSASAVRLFASSNTGPSRLQYGTMPSTLVDFGF
jgi:hypothetical protein